jgi:ribonuclease III
VATTPDDRPSRLSRDTAGLAVLGVPEGLGPLYELALTHRSYAFEQTDPIPHNERLEFLGDAILGSVVTDLIFTRYPELAEGEMARLRPAVVNTHALAEQARAVRLGEHIRLGRGEEGSGGREKDSLLANTFEAVVGAVYLDRGIEAVTNALVPLFERKISDEVEAGQRYDAKTALQEVAVRDTGELPTYRISSSGPDHDKRFSAHVFVDGDLCGVGSGRSKKEAEQNAAREALDSLGARRAGNRKHDARAS